MDVGTFSKNLWSTLEGWFSTLSFGEICLIVLTIILITIGIRQLKVMHRPKAKKPFPFDVVSLEKLAEILLPKKLEEYIERDQLKTELGQDLIPEPRLILIHSLPGVGKTREAVELIRRQNNLLGLSVKQGNIYLARGGELAIPTGLERGYPFRNIILCIDDLRTGLKVRDELEEDKKKFEPASERLRGTIDFFKEKCELRMTIATMLTEEYEKLKRESTGSKLLEEEKPLIIELKELPFTEKISYIEKLSNTFNLTIDESVKRSFVEASDESLTRLYGFFEQLHTQGKKRVEAEDVDEFKKSSKKLLRQRYNSLVPEERSILDTLTKLYQFSIPSLSYVVIELCISMKGGFKPLVRWRFAKALRNLDGKWLRVNEGKIYCPESKLFPKSPDDPGLHDDLELVSELIENLSRKRKYKKGIYYLLMPLTRVLHDYGMYERTIKLNDYILGLPLKALPINHQKTKSAVLFHKGHSYYCLGRKYWNLAEGCYKDSVQLYDQNLFAKHALATLYWKQVNAPEALKYLDEIIKANEKDLLAYKTKLEILTESGIDLNKAKKTYRDIKKLLREEPVPSKVALSAEFVCVRFSAKTGEFLRETGEIEKAEKRFTKARRLYRTFINKIPPEEKELKAVVQNAYGCFLYDVINKPDDAIIELEAACAIWPKHTRTLHKLASVYLEEAEIRVKERYSYVSKAKELLNKILTIDEHHYPARLFIARLEADSIDWESVNESEFWKEVSSIYSKYQKAVEPETSTYPSLHNSIAHHAMGCFLWHAEAMAHKRALLGNRPSSIPSADVEFTESITIEKCFKDTPPRSIQDHLILMYYTIGSYFMTIGQAQKSPDIFQKGQRFVVKAVNLNRQARSDFTFETRNSYVESFIGKLLLSISEKEEAKRLLAGAVSKYDKNWRAWWFLGRIYEIDEEFEGAQECFARAAEGQASPGLYGQFRSIVQDWMDKGKIIPDINLKIKYSQRAYELDSNGSLDPKNLSDYGFDLYQKGKKTGDQGILKKAKGVLLSAYRKYLEIGHTREANFPLWFVGECSELLNGRVDKEALRYYIESAILQDIPYSYSNLQYKIEHYAKYEEAIECFIDVIDCYPAKENVYITMISSCCVPIWRLGQTLNPDMVSKIEACANRHSEYPVASKMIGRVLQGNEECERALPHLEKVKASNDAFVLRALMECYASLGKTRRAEETYQELYPLLDQSGKEKLKNRALKLGLKCY